MGIQVSVQMKRTGVRDRRCLVASGVWSGGDTPVPSCT